MVCQWTERPWHISQLRCADTTVEFDVNDRKMSVALFHGAKCGTVEQDTEMFNCTVKLIPYGIWYDDGENGGEDANTERTNNKRKLLDEVRHLAEQHSSDLRELTTTIKHTLSALFESKEDTTENLRSTKLEKLRRLTVQRAELQVINIQDDITKSSLAIIISELKQLQDEVIGMQVK